MSGRGNLLSLFHKKTETSNGSSSSGEHAKDSGLDATQSVSSGEYRRIARDDIASELASTIQNVSISIGRGRANLLQSFKNESQQLRNEKKTSTFSTLVDDINSPGQKKELVQAKNSAFTCDRSEIKTNNSMDDTIYGTKGSPVNLSCNYIGVKSDPKKGVYLYEVRFNPPVDSIHLRMKYLNEHKNQFGGAKTFDGSILYLPILLERELTTFVSKNVDNKDIEIRLLFKKKESLKNCIQLYNILFDRVMKTLNYVKFDRKHFDPSRPKVIPMAKLEVWPGYVIAVDEFDGGLMLCCDVSHRLLCQKTVLDMLIEIYQHNKMNYQDKAKKYLVGSIVLTRYNNRMYRIDDICFSQNPHSEFETRTGSLSYVEYYKNHHNIYIKDDKQPLLISLKQIRKEKTVNTENIQFCLIPELCYLTGLQDEIRSDKKLMREIATFTSVTPNQRILALDKYFKNVSENDEAKEILENWGLSLFKNYHNAIGRKMDPEQIFFANQCISAGHKADFSKDAISNEMLEVKHIKSWIVIHQKTDVRSAKMFLANVERCCEAFGMSICKPTIITLEQDRVDTYVDALRRNISTQTQIVVCICPNIRDDRYSAIKKICCSELPVASQVINSRTLSNETKNRSIVQKIILQMNCKIGGSLWTVKIPFKNVMICGIDSYHDPRQKGSSVAALVASLNSSYTHWYSKAVIQTKKEEIVNGLTSSFEAALECYKTRNGYFPDNVIIYRDGVGDGQLNVCAKYEIPQFEVCNKSIKITFIIVQKRNNTRFFSESNNNFENPLPGTVVDKYITRTHMYDFFLVSQMVRQGSVSPTHFIVLRDDANYGPDIIQKLSYKLCFLYYNWPGTVRIPACCMYAHKMAYLIGQSIQRDTASNLSEKLFYL
ncbi:protein argonaute-3 [Drosophila novamexicana]|uniref:protein argonaute-3 n=1 Tax=Drosophila novamexicana TaxID=47314 RepID=UPI0011E5BD79|nr:protein argonaute-3 [Drosophila novamexicana]XP_030569876.1 protein argonaute-3 [Drosophila novamexicana]